MAFIIQAEKYRIGRLHGGGSTISMQQLHSQVTDGARAQHGYIVFLKSMYVKHGGIGGDAPPRKF